MATKKDGNLIPGIGDLLPDIIKPEHKPLTPVQERLLAQMPSAEEVKDILYQHSVLCQTSMPYRNPGKIKIWQRRNGFIRLELMAGRVLDPNSDEIVDVGLPFGPKPRLVLYHLNAEAMRRQSPLIELEDSLTAFVKRTLRLDVGGRTIRSVKEQLNRLSAADFRFYARHDHGAVTIKGTVIEGLDVWVTRDERQRVLWPSTVQFSRGYFESLLTHAVPLNEMAVARLSHNAMALDVYTWLAQRLHRVDLGKPSLVPWASLKEQFGHGYGRMDNFKRVFQTTLKQVAVVYDEAKFSIGSQGMLLSHSPPPVLRRLLPVR
jgi:hypothetical protein